MKFSLAGGGTGQESLQPPAKNHPTKQPRTIQSTRKANWPGIPGAVTRKKYRGIQIIAPHQLAPEVVGRAVFTLISPCPGVQVSGLRCKVSGKQAADPFESGIIASSS